MPLGKSVQISGFAPFDGKGLLSQRRFCVPAGRALSPASNQSRLSTLEGRPRPPRGRGWTAPWPPATRSTAGPAGPSPRRGGGAFFARSPSGRRRRTRCSPTGRSSRTGPFIIIGFVRFTRCTVMDSRCRHTVTSSTPGPVTLTGGSSFVAQSHGVAHELQVVDRQHLPERAIDVPREVRHAPGARLAQEDLRDVRPGLAHVDLLHRQVGIGRDQGDGRVREGLRRLHVELPRAVDDPRRVLEPAQQGMPPCRLVLEAEIRVADRPRPAARERDAEEPREAEVAARGTPLVAERGLERGHEAAAPPHEVAELRRTGGRRAPRRWAGRGS